MKLEAIEAFVVRIPFDDDQPYWGANSSAGDPQTNAAVHRADYPPLWRSHAVYAPTNEAVIVRIQTDTGIIGWGEAHTPIGGEITRTVIDSLLTPLLIGRDPTDIHPLWEAMYSTMRLRGNSSGYLLEAISGVDIALWDILGKHVGAPVAKLLGGKIRERVPVYASSLRAQDGEAGVEALVKQARALVEQGYSAFKVKLSSDLARDCHSLEALRAAVGSDVSIAVDVNGAYDLALARRAGELMQPFNILWLEEPLPPENRADYARLCAFLDVRVAGGECLCNRWIFNDYLAAGALDLVQPDVGRAGGISECSRISTLADVYGVPFAPHVSTGTAIYMAASLQWAASGANLFTCEMPLKQNNALNGVLNQPFDFRDGCVYLSDQPGLGIDLDETALRRWQV